MKYISKRKLTSKLIDGKEFIAVCPSDEIFEKKGKKFEFYNDADIQVAIFRVNGHLHCFLNTCPHRHAHEIYNGIISDNQITCPMHGWTYFVDTGKNINIEQGLKSLKKFSIFENDGMVYIEKPEEGSVPIWRKEEI